MHVNVCASIPDFRRHVRQTHSATHIAARTAMRTATHIATRIATLTATHRGCLLQDMPLRDCLEFWGLGFGV